MAITIKPERGRIIWAELLDPQGKNKKRRPAVILTSKEEIEAGESIFVVGISRQYYLSTPEQRVELYWKAPDGHPISKLKEKCAVKQLSILDLPIAVAINPVFLTANYIFYEL